jgi:malonyl CoA-acyl carrier protein transacylase
MGQALFDSPEYRSIERDVDTTLGYSVRELCLIGPESQLKDTRYTQPCLFVVNALFYRDALQKHGAPAALAGHSLGEYNALMAAGAFDLLTGVRLVARRGELMASVKDGTMAAILGMPTTDITARLHDWGFRQIDVANENAPLQTVIAGPATTIDRARSLFERAGASCIILGVSAPFHSRYMSDVAARFDQFLSTIPFSAIRIPVVANLTGEFYPDGCDAATIRAYLVQQIVKPVRWSRSIQYLQSYGITSFVETGPGGVLTRLCRQIERSVSI